MFNNLETYLQEISHFLSGREERDEILSEIRSHILEKAERESGQVTEASLDPVIAAYGTAYRVAEKYLDGRPIISPTFKRHLFRYTSLLFAIHFVLTVFSVVFKGSFNLFPFLFIPRLGAFEAILYLPTALLADFGLVAAILYFITQSGKEFKLPWPRFGLDLDELETPDKKVLAARIMTTIGAGVMLVITGVAVDLFIRFHTILFVSFNFRKLRPLLMPEPGRQVSLIVISMLAAGTIGLFIKIFSHSRRITCWVDTAADSIALVLLGLLLRQPTAGLFAVRIAPALLSKIRFCLTIILLFVALMIAIDLVRNLILIGRRQLAKQKHPEGLK